VAKVCIKEVRTPETSLKLISIHGSLSTLNHTSKDSLFQELMRLRKEAHTPQQLLLLKDLMIEVVSQQSLLCLNTNLNITGNNAALIATVTAEAGTPPTVGLVHSYFPSNREDYDNAKELWKGDWAKYRTSHPNDQDCSISESDNWKGAQQCSQSWECRGARLCERGGWCSGYDGCEGATLPDQAPGLAVDH
jgi:hypothetical protein